MSLFGNGAIRHGSCFEALCDFRSRFDLLQRNSFSGVELEFHEPTKGIEIPGLIIDQFTVACEKIIISQPGSLLQKMDTLGVKEMAFPIGPPLVEPPSIEGLVLNFSGLERVVMTNFYFLRNHIQSDALYSRSGTTKIFINNFFIKADTLKNLSSSITGNR